MFTVLGEALLDMVQPAPGDTYRALPAGGPLNIAVGLRRLGHPTAMMARFSSGALGSRVREFAEASDLDLSASVTTDQQATLAFATVDEQGRATYDFFVQRQRRLGVDRGRAGRRARRRRRPSTPARWPPRSSRAPLGSPTGGSRTPGPATCC